MQAQVEAQLNHGHGTAVNYSYSGEGMAIHPTTPSQNFDSKQSPPAPALRRTTRLTRKSLPRFDPTLQYRTMAEPAWSNPPALTAPTPRYPTVQEPTVRVTSRNHLPLAHVHACHAQHQSDYQTHTPSSHHSLVWRTHRSASPRPLMPLTPLPIKRPTGKKPPLACFFCRGRKIACGPPIPGSKDKTCK